MSTVLLVGTGQVATRAARQLVDTPGVDRVLIASRDGGRAAALASAMGPRAAPAPELRRGSRAGASWLAEEAAAVAVATDAPGAAPWVEVAIAGGVRVATVGCADGGSRDRVVDAAGSAGVAVVTGCGLVPGLADVLVRHAADLFDAVDEVHVARAGADPGACAEEVREARRQTPGEWRDGAWRTDRAFGPELLWFPEPVGARECQLVHQGVAATVATVPSVRHVTARLAAPPAGRSWRRWARRDPLDAGWGAVRVEVTGWRDGVAGSVVYGVVDRTAVVAGVVLAVTAAALSGSADAGIDVPVGARALGEVAAPVRFLGEIARRGVKAAVFEGVVPAA